MKSIVEAILAIASVVGIAIGAFLYLENRHADKRELEVIRMERLETEIGLRREIVDRDVKKDAEAREHYRKLELTRSLTPVEKQRKEYLERQIALKDSEAKELEDREMDLKMKKNIVGGEE